MTDFQTRVGRWGEVTFPQSTPVSIAKHLQEEAAEFQTAWAVHDFKNGREGVSPEELELLRRQVAEEAADVFLMLQHLEFRIRKAAEFMGFDLAAAAEEKFEICRRRKWEMDPARGYAKHVEEGESR